MRKKREEMVSIKNFLTNDHRACDDIFANISSSQAMEDNNEEEKQKVSVKLIVDVVSARLEETFSLLNEKITTSGIRNKM